MHVHPSWSVISPAGRGVFSPVYEMAGRLFTRPASPIPYTRARALVYLRQRICSRALVELPWHNEVVRRAVFIAFFTILTFDVSGLAALCGDTDCDESCPSDVSGGQCAPNCHFCSCCSLPKIASPGAATTTYAPLTHDLPRTRSSDRPISPDPADILHVPIGILA